MRKLFIGVFLFVVLSNFPAYSDDKMVDENEVDDFIRIMEIDEGSKTLTEINARQRKKSKESNIALKKQRDEKYSVLKTSVCNDSDPNYVCRKKIEEYCMKTAIENENCEIFIF